MLLYLDLNCFNRPFDDQSQDRIARETAAVFSVLQRIIDGLDHLAWSAILDVENAQHPLVDRRTEVARWAQRAALNISIGERVSARAQELTEAGFGALAACRRERILAEKDPTRNTFRQKYGSKTLNFPLKPLNTGVLPFSPTSC